MAAIAAVEKAYREQLDKLCETWLMRMFPTENLNSRFGEDLMRVGKSLALKATMAGDPHLVFMGVLVRSVVEGKGINFTVLVVDCKPRKKVKGSNGERVNIGFYAMPYAAKLPEDVKVEIKEEGAVADCKLYLCDSVDDYHRKSGWMEGVTLIPRSMFEAQKVTIGNGLVKRFLGAIIDGEALKGGKVKASIDLKYD